MWGIFIRTLALALALFPAIVEAQSPLRAFPPGTFQNRQAIDGGGGGGGSYAGPGDIISYTAYYGLSAYSSATRGSKLVNVCNSTGGVDVGCGDLSSSATTGQLVSATIGGITCPGANCTIKIFYDLTGGNACTSATCDVTQATIASRMTLGTSCAPLSVSVCATSTGARYVGANNLSSSAAPVFFSASVNVAFTGNQQAFIGDNSAIQELFSWSHGGAATGLSGDGTATDLWFAGGTGAYHSHWGLINGASSYVGVDTSAPTTGTLSFNTSNTVINLAGDGVGNNIAAGGIFLEAGLALTAPSSATAQSEASNRKTFWGY